MTSGNVTQVVNFSDQSSNSPTAWSWAFGDSNTSTAQSPSHTYTAAGTYSVVLTATNAGGSDTCTKSNYITVSAFQANFTATPTWGLPPLAVNFTDASLNNATAWSWTFGDGATSTAQNPSHTYTSSGYYTASLHSSNAYASDTCSQTITVCSGSFTLSPSSYVIESGDGTYVSGSVSDLVSADSNYMVFNQTNSAAFKGLGPEFYAVVPSQYRSQVFGLSYQEVSHCDSDNALRMWVCASWPPHTSDPWEGETSVINLTTTDAQGPFAGVTGSAKYMASDGTIGVRLCGCTLAAGSVNMYVNQIQFTVYLAPTSASPPVANFSGTPTSGNAPLNVSFTDSSTNSPTSWSWTFGDGGSSTAQNPSHTYSTAGNYTVTLTATNAAGSSSPCSMTNYISVTATAVLYPTSYFVGQGSLVSGALSDLQSSDSAYMIFASNTDSCHGTNVQYYFSTGYTPSQVSKIKLEWQLHSSRSDSPSLGILVRKTDNSGYTTAVGSMLWGTTDSTQSWETTDVSTYLYSDGSLVNYLCACGRDVGQNYQIP